MARTTGLGTLMAACVALLLSPALGSAGDALDATAEASAEAAVSADVVPAAEPTAEAAAEPTAEAAAEPTAEDATEPTAEAVPADAGEAVATEVPAPGTPAATVESAYLAAAAALKLDTGADEPVSLLGLTGQSEAAPTISLVTGADGQPIMVLNDASGSPTAPTASETKNGAGFVDVFTSLNVRSGPGIENGRIGSLGPGQRVTVLGQKDGWSQIAYNGGTAWVSSNYVWQPGEEMRNGAIREDIATSFRRDGNAAQIPAPRPVPQFSQGVSGDEPTRPSTPRNGYRPASPAGVANGAGSQPLPTGSQQGQRLADGGLAIPLYNQNAIGASNPSGFCGPTSLKMAMEYYGINKDINFIGNQDVGGATPVYNRGAGAGHQAMLDMVKYCGLQGSTMNHGQSIAWLKQQTDAGYPVIVSVRGNYGPRSTAGHILCVAGVTANGDVIVNDSAGGNRVVCPANQFYNAWSSSSRMAIVVKP